MGGGVRKEWGEKGGEGGCGRGGEVRRWGEGGLWERGWGEGGKKGEEKNAGSGRR